MLPKHKPISVEAGVVLRHDHVLLSRNLGQLQKIADMLDDATPEAAVALIVEANGLVRQHIVPHEREDERAVYPRLAKALAEVIGLSAMSRAHREILHLARLLDRLTEDLPQEEIDRYLIRDAQRIIESIYQIVRIHTEQEEDMYDALSAL